MAKSGPVDPVFKVFIIPKNSKILESIWGHFGKYFFAYMRHIFENFGKAYPQFLDLFIYIYIYICVYIYIYIYIYIRVYNS